MLKNYGYSLLLIIISLFAINLINTLLNYFNLLSPKIISIMGFMLFLFSMLVSSYILGTKSKQKGYLEGLKFGSIVVLLFIILIILLDKFYVKSLIYYAILILTSILGSMIGINKKNK